MLTQQSPRDLCISIGVLKPGEKNGITDVEGLKVGHTTLIKEDSIRTGVIAILPHLGNLFQEKVPAAIMTSKKGTVEALPTDKVLAIMKWYNKLKQ